MKFLFLLISVCIIPSSSTSVTPYGSWDTKPLACEWKHKDGKSGYLCENGEFSDNEADLYPKMAPYTSIHKIEPPDVTYSNGWPIDIKNVIDGMYEKINQERQIHRVNTLTVDLSLANRAQEHANQLAQNNKQYSTIWKNGESNVYVTKNELSQIVNKWYDQNKSYNYENPEGNFVLETGDFSQMVWGSSKKIGCGVSNNGPNYFAVCIYDPPGNVKGQYNDNVKKDYATVNFGFGRR